MNEMPPWFLRQWAACVPGVRYAGEFHDMVIKPKGRRDHWSYFAVHEGSLTVRSFGFDLVVPAGHAVILPPYRSAQIGSADPGKRVVATTAGFDLQAFGEAGNPLSRLGLPVGVEQGRSEMRTQFWARLVASFEDWRPASPVARARAGNWLALLLLDYVETGFATKAFTVSRLGPVPAWVQKLASQLRAGAARPNFKTTALYRSSGYHRNQVTNAFKAYLGETPSRMLGRHRLELAIERLTSNPEMSLAEVAQTSGYTSQAAFNRHFLRLTGKTPGQFRRAG